MGHKVNPIGLRLGINRTWDSRWYAGRNYADLLHDDFRLRSYLEDRLKQAGVSKIIIERPAGKARVTIHSARPGVVIGRKGADIEKLRLELQKLTGTEAATASIVAPPLLNPRPIFIGFTVNGSSLPGLDKPVKRPRADPYFSQIASL